MHASQFGIQTPAAEVAAKARLLREKGLAVSMVTGDFAVSENTDEGPAALRNITPTLDLAAALDCDTIRFALRKEEDIVRAQRAADIARERGIRLAHQCHTRSLFEKVDEMLEVLRRIDRPNYGLTYVAAPYSPPQASRLAGSPVALRDTAVGAVRVPKSTLIFCRLRHDSVDARLVPQAASFLPERWLAEGGPAQAAKSAKCISMPFGAGPHVCPGRYLAMLEIKMAMAVLFGQFDLASVETPDGGEARETMAFTM